MSFFCMQLSVFSTRFIKTVLCPLFILGSFVINLFLDFILSEAIVFKKNIYVFIYLSVLGLSCGTLAL